MEAAFYDATLRFPPITNPPTHPQTTVTRETGTTLVTPGALSLSSIHTESTTVHPLQSDTVTGTTATTTIQRTA